MHLPRENKPRNEQEEMALQQAQALFCDTVQQVFPLLGLNPENLILRAWIRQDYDTDERFPLLGVRWKGLDKQTFEGNALCDVQERWPCWDLSGTRPFESVQYLLKLLWDNGVYATSPNSQ